MTGVVGRAAATPFARFSPAMKKSGIVWTAEKIDACLVTPIKMVPGTIMIASAQDRADVIAYLKTLMPPAA